MPNLLKLKRGTSATIPNGQLAEPLFTSDTYDLYVGKGNGSNQRFQKYIASGTSSQFLKGDGSLDSTSYQTALTFSSPLVNTSGTISIPAATGSVNGYLTSTDWTTFNNKQPLITAGTTLQYYRGDKTFQTLNTSVVPESGAIYFTEPRVLATVLTGLNLSGGGTIAATDSVLTAFGKVQNQISALVGGATYQGVWNASTNSPALSSGTGTKGYYYVVSVAGSTNLDGITDWKVGDWAIFNGTTWDKVDNTDAVSSVNGFTGAVNLGLGNISDVTLSSPTNTQLLRFNGTSSKWENWTPTYISAAITSLNGLTAATQTFATGTTGTDFTISSSTSTHTFNIPSASATSRGLLTSGDYNTFALKQSAITLTTTGTSGAATFVGATLNIPNYGSALSGYLPLTGGTLTGSLFGTTASFTSNTSNFTLGSQVDTAIYMHFGTKNASGGYGIGHRIAGTINATANFDNLHGLWVDYTDNVGAYVGVVKYAIFQPDSAKQNYFGGTTIFNSFIWAQSTIAIGVNSTAYDLYIRKTAAYAMIESYTNSATSQLYFKGNNASSIAVTGGIIYTPSTSGNHNISITPDTTTSLGMILNTNSAGFGVIPKATTYYSLQSDYGVLSGNLAANISSNSYYNSGWKFYGTGFATLYNQDPSTGKHEFFTSASGSSGGSVSFGTAKFSIAQSGAATFSSSVTAATESNFTGTSVNSRILITAAGVANTVLGFNNSGSTVNGVVNNAGYIGILQSYPLIFTIADVERMRITSGGNVGIGTSSPLVPLHVETTGTSTSVGGNVISTFRSQASGRTATIQLSDNTNSNFISSISSNLIFGYSSTEAMRITSGGNVGIGTSSPYSLLQVTSGTVMTTTGGDQASNATIEGANVAIGANFTSQLAVLSNSAIAADIGGGVVFGSKYSGNAFAYYAAIKTGKDDATSGNFGGYLQFATRANGGNITERLRITSGGYLKASNNGTYFSTTGAFSEFCNNTTNTPALFLSQTNTSFTDNVLFVEGYTNTTNNTWYLISAYNRTAAAYKFRVADSGNVTNTNGSYGAISDIKLKENIIDATPKLSDLLKVKIKNFNYIGSNEKQLGVIAQELEEIFPSMIEQHIDRDEDGNDLGTTTKSVKYSIFVPMLIKAIQEQQQQIEQLKAKLI